MLSMSQFDPGGTQEPPNVTLLPITAENWIACVDLKVAPDQELMIASNAMSLAQAAYQPQCRPLGIYAETPSGERMIGFLMYARRPKDGRHWILRVMIDAEFQGHGYGRAAMRAILEDLAERDDCKEVLISYFPTNEAARGLYASLGFVETGEFDEDGEAIACLSLAAG